MQLSAVPGIGEKTLHTLASHQLSTIHDLITYFPRSYRTYHATSASHAHLDDWVTLTGTLTRPISKHTTHVTTQLSTFADESGSLTLRWFNMPYLPRSIDPTALYQIRGQLTIFGNTRQIVAPQFTKLPTTSYQLPATLIQPIYPSLGTLKSGVLRKIIRSALDSLSKISDPLALSIRQKHHLIDLDSAIRTLHNPPSRTVLEGAIHRLAFDELYTLQLESLEKSELNKIPTTPLHWNTETLEHWITDLPYIPTSAQTRVIKEILADLSKPIAMHRLLAGEVGSGKTMVAAAASYATHLSGFQTLVMAPTQILAEQLAASFTLLLSDLSVSLVTAGSSGSLEADIVVGTQALLSPKHKPAKVGLVIVDEQHKFGVKQRDYLASLTPAPHVLTMTATPIPRTLAMTIFSNLDISRLDELPASRLPIKTYLVGEEKRERAYAWIKNEITLNHNQVFVVVPLIEEAEDAEGNPQKSLKLLEINLKKRFPSLSIDIMHGKMKEAEKTEHLQAFRDGTTDILVATSMVEVGLDIPAANIMVVEDAQRFGLAQLHQLRGRVGRGSTQGYCLLFVGADPRVRPKIYERINYFAKESNGEKLALFDLESRGPGELFGLSQHGFFSLRFASIYDTALLKETYEAVRIHPI